MRRTTRRTASGVLGTAALILVAGCGPNQAAGGFPPPPRPALVGAKTASEPEDLPAITPKPRQIRRTSPDIPIPERVQLRTGQGVDEATKELVRRTFESAGAQHVDSGEQGNDAGNTALTVIVGTTDDPMVTQSLKAADVTVTAPLPDEGYVLTVEQRDDGGLVVLAGNDSSGAYYAAQTLLQLAGGGKIPGVSIVDYPAAPLRGVVEGFYGRSWSFTERLDQLAFYGAMKMNTYLYAPKDDPYHRDRWREPYPPDEREKLRKLVEQARRNHVRFTFAISPGQSVCYSSTRDRDALRQKMRTVHDLGVRDFSIAFDDTYPLPTWGCSEDIARYGVLSEATAGMAQADLLNAIQRDFLDTLDGTRPVRMVPVQYSEVRESPYKQALREQLDPRIQVMWTGTDVLPAAISTEDARQARAVWGRKVLLWDNYPANDFDKTKGRLLLAPYDKRDSGTTDELAGFVLNPMNQASASKPALFTAADFTWNPEGYDPQRSLRNAAEFLAGGDEATAEALRVLFDVEHYAASWTGEIWQAPAPELKRRLDIFRTKWATSDRKEAIAELRSYAKRMTDAPATIRKGVVDSRFVSDIEPWLDALQIWGQALASACDALDARVGGNEREAQARFAEMRNLATQAEKIRTRPGTTREQGPIKIADGVLDAFLREAPGP
ncbi:beta-N-acetylglucosaminidase [Longimycelium tulufanense]|uniref:Beta-N-acetylglucosaminidase n=1 Tax=Longimycelium tulufanense TaxID=907463 RepID=A0A8J3CB89_9PSEU|nr:beta-N-acetylglucosaminidase domain-containing protein [Longimycelium tulufanense]GGM43530.1 beta-N-acetylglucosaminidase [Longimycelium tulufanense]